MMEKIIVWLLRQAWFTRALRQQRWEQEWLMQQGYARKNADLMEYCESLTQRLRVLELEKLQTARQYRLVPTDTKDLRVEYYPDPSTPSKLLELQLRISGEQILALKAQGPFALAEWAKTYAMMLAQEIAQAVLNMVQPVQQIRRFR